MRKMTILSLSVAAALAAFGRMAVPARTRPMRIALVADTHTNRGAQGDQPRYRERFERAIAEINAAEVDLVLIAGDLTENGAPEQMEDFRAQIQGFRAPVRCIPGNHDVGDKHLPGKEGGVTAARVAQYEKALGPSFFVEVCGGARVLGLNASLFGSGLPREADQWAFLEHECAQPDTMPTLVLLHYPPFLKTPDEPGDPYWNLEPEPRARLLSLLQQGGVRAVLSGHLHRPINLRHDGILYVTTPPVSFGLPPGRQPEGWTLVTVKPDGTVQTAFRPLESK
jgi:3',5'-cyclic AMP phosphodiesterase CpdA